MVESFVLCAQPNNYLGQEYYLGRNGRDGCNDWDGPHQMPYVCEVEVTCASHVVGCLRTCCVAVLLQFVVGVILGCVGL